MVRPCDEDERGAHSEKIARCGQRKEERWKDACKRDMTEAELKDMITSGVVNERHYTVIPLYNAMVGVHDIKARYK